MSGLTGVCLLWPRCNLERPKHKSSQLKRLLMRQECVEGIWNSMKSATSSPSLPPPRVLLSKLEYLGYRFTQRGHELTAIDLEAMAFNARFVCLPNGHLLHS